MSFWQPEALKEWRADQTAGTKRTMREYAKRWGVSVSTAHGWIRGVEQPQNKPNTGSEHAPNTCRTCTEQAERISEILRLVRFLVSSNSVVLKENNSPSLRSEEAEQPNTKHRTPSEQVSPSQPDLLDVECTIPEPGRMLNLLDNRTPPARLDGTTPADKAEWLGENWSLIWLEVDGAMQKGDTEKQRNSRLKALMLRWWQNRRPQGPNGGGMKSFEQQDEERRAKSRAAYLAGDSP